MTSVLVNLIKTTYVFDDMTKILNDTIYLVHSLRDTTNLSIKMSPSDPILPEGKSNIRVSSINIPYFLRVFFTWLYELSSPIVAV